MLKNKIIKACIITLSVHSSICATDKLYAGISIGQTSSHINLDRDLTIGSKDSSNMGKDAFNSGIFMGYNYLIEPPLFIGIEVGAQNHNIESIREENTFPPYVHYETRVRTNNSLIGSLKMGIVVKDLMIYGKGGIVRTNWNVNFSEKPKEYSKSDKITKDGLIFGFGIDYNLNPNWAIGVDYTVANYPNLKLTHDVGEFKMSPCLRTTTFRLTYLF